MVQVTINRRELLTRSICAGSLVCVGSNPLLAALSQENDSETHKFQAKSGMTYEEVFRFAFVRGYIPIMKVLADRVGLDVLQKAAYDAAYEGIKDRPFPKRDIPTIAHTFKNLNPHAKQMLTMEVIEDNETAFEMKVTECLWAKTFREANAADIGFSCICNVDYATAEAFSPKVELIRDKTLMQGHTCCNHRYVMKV